MRWIVAVALLAGCGPDADDYPLVRTERCATCDAGVDAGPEDAGPEPIPDEPLEDWDTTDAGPLSGIFAVEVTVLANVIVDIEARQLLRVRVLQRDDTVRLRTQICRIDLPTVAGVAELSIPRPLERLIQTKDFEDEGPFLSQSDPIGASFAPPETTLVLGAVLDDPRADPLPTIDDLGRAIDEDDDGNPGVTIDAETVLCRRPERAYAAIRTSVTLTATLEDVDAFSGSIDPTLDQSVLGFTDPCLSAAAELEITIREGSTFRAIRVGDESDIDGNGNVSCPEINRLATTLFVEG